MIPSRATICTFLAVIACLLGPRDVRAAESYDNCSGFVTSLPAVITTQGTWCLTADLATAMTSGVAITIATNNVTIDCNNFKLGGLSAGVDTTTIGIFDCGGQSAEVPLSKVPSSVTLFLKQFGKGDFF